MPQQRERIIAILVALPWMAFACRVPMTANAPPQLTSTRAPAVEVVQPVESPPVEESAPQTAASAPELLFSTPPEPPAVKARTAETAESDRLLEQADLALDQLETGSVQQAQQEIDKLTLLFPENESARLIETLLRRKLARLQDAAADTTLQPARNADAASSKLLEARSLLKGGRDELARLDLEAAHTLDPANVEITDGLVALLKKMGLELYSRGEAAQAVSYWQRVLEIRAGDAETLRFIQRANAVNRRR